MDEESLFIRRSDGEPRNYTYTSDAFFSPYGPLTCGQTRIVDDVRPVEWAQHSVSVDEAMYERNAPMLCQIGSLLYLDATTVLQTCRYWLAEYSDADVPTHMQFAALISGILTEPPHVEVSGQYGLRYEADNIASYCLLAKFVGTDLHRVPAIYYTLCQNGHLSSALAYLTHPDNECFLAVSSPGLKAEFQASACAYEALLHRFFEPSFYVLTCFLLLTQYVSRTIPSKVFQARPRITKRVYTLVTEEIGYLSLQILQHGLSPLLSEDLPRQLSYLGPDAYRRFEQDMLQLQHTVQEYALQPERLEKEVGLLWQRKAHYCAAEMAARTQTILASEEGVGGGPPRQSLLC